MAFPTALVDTLGLEADDSEALLEALADRDYPLLETIVSNASDGDEALKALQATLALGGTRDSLAQARKLATTPAMEAAIERLVRVRDLVGRVGVRGRRHLRLRTLPGPGLLHRRDLRSLGARASDCRSPRAAATTSSRRASSGRCRGSGFAIALDRLRDALDEAGRLPATAPAPLAFAGGFEEPARLAELRRAGLSVAALPDDAAPPAPSLRREGGRYLLELADGSKADGSWREILRALGLG